MISKQGCLGLIPKAVKHWKNIIKHLEKDSEIWHLFLRGGWGGVGRRGGGCFFMTLRDGRRPSFSAGFLYQPREHPYCSKETGAFMKRVLP